MNFRSSTVALAFASLCAATPAPSQAASATLTIQSGYPSAVNRDNCLNGEDVVVDYDFPDGVPYSDTMLRIFLTNQSTCPDTAADKMPTFLSDSSNTSGNVTIDAGDLGKAVGGSEDCPDNVTGEFLVCAVWWSDSSSSSKQRTSLSLRYDSQPPEAPVITSAKGGDSAIYLNWSSNEDSAAVGHWTVYYRPIGSGPTNVDPCGSEEGDAGVPDGAEDSPDIGADSQSSALDAGFDSTGFESTDLSGSDARSGAVRDLVNEQQYELFMVVVDSAGNVSGRSNSITASPLTVQDFYKRYRCRGGQEMGGFSCSTAGPALAPLIGLGIIAALRWRRRPE
jgi:MYXO-CTERM domain-containing protein